MELRLKDKVVLVSRPREQSEELKRLLENEGALVRLQPAITIEPPESWREVDDVVQLALNRRFDWILFSSANGARFVMQRCSELYDNPATLLNRSVKIAVVGSGTANVARELGLDVALVPDRFDAEGLVDALRERLGDQIARQKFLSFRANRGRDVLRERLAELGASIQEVVAYRSLDVERADATILDELQRGEIDCAVVTSSASARALAKILGNASKNTRWVALSPLTAKAAEDVGIRIDGVAEVATSEGLVDAVSRALANV